MCIALSRALLKTSLLTDAVYPLNLLNHSLNDKSGRPKRGSCIMMHVAQPGIHCYFLILKVSSPVLKSTSYKDNFVRKVLSFLCNS